MTETGIQLSGTLLCASSDEAETVRMYLPDFKRGSKPPGLAACGYTVTNGQWPRKMNVQVQVPLAVRHGNTDFPRVRIQAVAATQA